MSKHGKLLQTLALKTKRNLILVNTSHFLRFFQTWSSRVATEGSGTQFGGARRRPQRGGERRCSAAVGRRLQTRW